MGCMSASNVKLAREGFQAVLNGDLDAIADLLAPDVQWHGGDPDAEGACRNRDQALAFMRAARTNRPLAELVDVIDAGDKVVVLLSRDGEQVANLTTFKDGKVTEMVHYPDPQDALKAAGLG